MSREGSITPTTIRRNVAPGKDAYRALCKDAETYRDNAAGSFQAFCRQHSGQVKQNELAYNKLEGFCVTAKLKPLRKNESDKWQAREKVVAKPHNLFDKTQDNPLIRLQEFQSEKDSKSDGTTDIKKPYVQHFTIAGSKILSDHFVKADSLHPFETALFEGAISSIKDKKPASEAVDESSTYRNIVLVSFFNREANTISVGGFYPMCMDGKIVATHTIALWKTGDKEITIIDPSDSGFSKFLLKPLNDTYKDDGWTFVQEQYSQKEGRKGKIYSPKHGTGNPRDCTDIAVKIALEIISQQVKCSSVGEVTKATIEQISNTKLPKEMGLFRPLQSSDSDTRLEAKGFVDQYKNTELLKTLDTSKIESVEAMQCVIGIMGEIVPLEDL